MEMTIAVIMKNREMTNCITIKDFLNVSRVNNLMPEKFFNTTIGLKEDSNKAGNSPASNPTPIPKQINQM